MKVESLARIDLNLLVSLQVLLEEQSCTRAAERLHLSQSAMSKTLARLRDVFQDPLLVRNAHGMLPTPHAEQLRDPLQTALQHVSKLLDPPSFNPNISRRHFTLTSIDSAYQLFLPSYFGPLLSKAPNIELDYRPWNAQSAHMLTQGQIELGITVKENVSNVPWKSTVELPTNLHSQPLTDDYMVCLVRRGHPVLSKKSRWSLKTYLKLGHVQAYCEGKYKWMLDFILADQGYERIIAAKVPEFQAALTIIQHSDLIFTGPKQFATYAKQHYPLVELPLPLELPTITYLLTWHERFDEDPGHQWLRQMLVEYINPELSEAC
ncbi:LysR family transcriptional regulator [Spartinivicinus poritis]|uniref:LysR family transcriptional regulator n=1 Tax=Spartinivicinus poritis TaxID=2994640 RepID=A0ABT5UAM6_9GAMM|nr:LysR family transcriptional regulator [Spartinivicinus sp. A2-2]MDE1463420.1 LysR family transcriptional regulator [Spartinivicinus sp. A2-2]